MNAPNVIESFSLGEISRLSQVNPRTLDHWAATGFLPPSVRRAGGTGTKRAYSFADVVAARVAGDLRRAGASLQRLRKTVRELRKRDFNTNPLAETLLIVSGREVYFLDDNQQLVAILETPGQMHFDFPFTVLKLGHTAKLLRSEAEKLKAA